MSPIALITLALGAVGHVILWVTLVNRIHGLGIDRRLVHGMTVLFGLMLAATPLVLAAYFFGLLRPSSEMLGIFLANVLWSYVFGCAIVFVVAVVQRWMWWQHPERRGALLASHTTHCEAAGQAAMSAPRLTAPGIPTWLSKLPGNQVLSICVEEKQIAIPRLSQSGELRIVHLTDLHMSGRVTRAYFERVVELTNETNPDLVAITGDIVERERCIDWIPGTLGRLRAPSGVYFVLGNHDRHKYAERIKAALTDAGLVHVGGACRRVTIGNTPVVLAGNEIPWFRPAADLNGCPQHDAAGLPLRIILSHSPDQFEWAQANQADLVLAGHLHGGQVRVPFLGAILAPSCHGVRYACGVFSAGSTVMHVSRGTGSWTPIRYNCPPEIAVLLLRAGCPA